MTLIIRGEPLPLHRALGTGILNHRLQVSLGQILQLIVELRRYGAAHSNRNRWFCDSSIHRDSCGYALVDRGFEKSGDYW
jgi:hypothetical protein